MVKNLIKWSIVGLSSITLFACSSDDNSTSIQTMDGSVSVNMESHCTVTQNEETLVQSMGETGVFGKKYTWTFESSTISKFIEEQYASPINCAEKQDELLAEGECEVVCTDFTLKANCKSTNPASLKAKDYKPTLETDCELMFRPDDTREIMNDPDESSSSAIAPASSALEPTSSSDQMVAASSSDQTMQNPESSSEQASVDPCESFTKESNLWEFTKNGEGEKKIYTYVIGEDGSLKLTIKSIQLMSPADCQGIIVKLKAENVNQGETCTADGLATSKDESMAMYDGNMNKDAYRDMAYRAAVATCKE